MANLQISPEQIQQILSSVAGKNIEARRIEALEKAGYKATYFKRQIGFGRACTVKTSDAGILAQLTCSESRTNKKGYSFSYCDVYLITA